MTVSKIKNQLGLNINELANFFSQFLIIFREEDVNPGTEDKDLLSGEICLKDTERMFAESYDAFKRCIKRIRKMDQTEVIVQCDKRRMKLLTGIINYINGMAMDLDASKASAAEALSPVAKEFRNYYRLTRAAKTVHIKRFIGVLRDESNAPAVEVLALADRLAELEEINRLCTTLTSERSAEMENIPPSPSEMRQQCVSAYRELVDLINFALKNNRYYIYDELALKLEGITQKAQELINRRYNRSKKKQEMQ